MNEENLGLEKDNGVTNLNYGGGFTEEDLKKSYLKSKAIQDNKNTNRWLDLFEFLLNQSVMCSINKTTLYNNLKEEIHRLRPKS